MATNEIEWRILGASVAGASHVQRGRGCEDAHGFRMLDDGSLVIAVADGAGSAKRSAEGSSYAIQSAMESIERRLAIARPTNEEDWHTLLESSLHDGRVGLESLTVAINSTDTDPDSDPGLHSSLRDFATTLLLVVVTPGWVGCVQVGDGAAVMLTSDGSLQMLTAPERSEYINETVFLTSKGYLESAQFHVEKLTDVQGIAALTDGLQFLALNMTENMAYPAFFEPLFAFAKRLEANKGELAAFLASERVNARTDDDKTLVLAVRT